MARKVSGCIEQEKSGGGVLRMEGEFSGGTASAKRAWWCKVGGTSPFPWRVGGSVLVVKISRYRLCGRAVQERQLEEKSHD